VWRTSLHCDSFLTIIAQADVSNAPLGKLFTLMIVEELVSLALRTTADCCRTQKAMHAIHDLARILSAMMLINLIQLFQPYYHEYFLEESE
jgi:hypothetical protein